MPQFKPPEVALEKPSPPKPVEVPNCQGIQGESLHGLNQFSFGQISPRFYEDQPAANLLEEEDASRNNKKANNSSYIKVSEYCDGEPEKVLRRQKSEHEESELWNTGSKKFGSTKQQSFSKTPCFIKSPNRSLASSHHYFKDILSQEDPPHFNPQVQSIIDPPFTKPAANSAAVVLASEGPRRSRISPKLSQSSDEIAHTVNAFYERKTLFGKSSPSKQQFKERLTDILANSGLSAEGSLFIQ